jgi:hypothetical protein
MLLPNLNRAAGQSGIQKEFLERYVVPLPPLHQQRAIAAEISKKMLTVEKARAAAHARLEATMALPVAFVREAIQFLIEIFTRNSLYKRHVVSA